MSKWWRLCGLIFLMMISASLIGQKVEAAEPGGSESDIHIVASSEQTRLKTTDALNVLVDVTVPGGDMSVVTSVYYEWNGIVAGTLTTSIKENAGNAEIKGLRADTEGTHRLDITVSTTDDAKTSSYFYVFDDTAPILFLESATDPNTAHQSHTVTVNLDDSDADDRYFVSHFWSRDELDLIADSITWPDQSEQTSNPSYSSPADEEGFWYLYVKVSDEAGNDTTDVFGPLLLDNTPPELTLINGQAPACEAAIHISTIMDCSGTASAYPTPLYPLFVDLEVDGKFGDDLQGYRIYYRVVESPELESRGMVVSGWNYRNNTGRFQLTGYTNPEVLHERYVQLQIVDPAGNESLYLSDKFTIDPDLRDFFLRPAGYDNIQYIHGSTIDMQVYFYNGGNPISNLRFFYGLNTVANDDFAEHEVLNLTLSEEEGLEEYYTANVALDLGRWTTLPACDVPSNPWELDQECPLIEDYEYWLFAYYQDPDSGASIMPLETLFYYDVTPPQIDSVTYNPPSDSDADEVSSVTATIAYSDDRMLPNGEKTDEETITFTANDTRTVTIMDTAGNSVDVELVVDWIQSTYTVAYSPVPGEWTNESVTATITFDAPVSFDDMDAPVLERVYTIEENGSYMLGYQDGSGIAGAVELTVDWIDRTAPIGTVFYAINDSGPGIVASVVTSDNSGEATVWVDANGNEIAEGGTHIFTANGTYVFYFKDVAGNIGSAMAQVTNFDTTPPVLSVQYSTMEPTNATVRATLKADEPIKVLNNGGSISYDFEENGTYTFEAEDRFGNRSSVAATVTNIDKEPPSVVIVYSTTETTKDDVVATVSLAPEDAGGEFSVLNNYGRKSYVFTENGTFTFIVADPAGNRTEVTATVSHIDKSKVSYTLAYSETALTTSDVTVTVVPEAGKTLYYPDNGGSPSVTFYENGMTWLRAIDDLGNEYWITMMVQWIDREAPTISIDRDYMMAQDGLIPDLDQGVMVRDNFGDYTLTRTGEIDSAVLGEYIVTYTATDTVGNVSTAERKVRVVDSSALVVYVNGQLASDAMNLPADSLRIEVFGTRGAWELQGAYGQHQASHFKTGRYMLDPASDHTIDRQGYYTLFVRDQELQQQVIYLYVIPLAE